MKKSNASKLFGGLRAGKQAVIKIEDGRSNLYIGNELIEKGVDYWIQDGYSTYIDESGAEYLCPENYTESRVKGAHLIIYSDGTCRAW